MIRFVLKRVVSVVPTLLITTSLLFVMVAVSPKDPAAQLAGETATTEQIEAIRAELGLDEPLPVRYVEWLGNAAQGDLGKSYSTRQEVSEAIFDRLPPTLSIAGLAILVSVLAGLLFGTVAALRPGSVIDRGIGVGAAILVATPTFVFALLLVVQFAVQRQVFPAIGYVDFTEDPWEWFMHLVLPAVALATYPAAELALQLRASMIDTLDRDFILSARARGLRRGSVVFKHALRSAAVPVVAILSLRMSLILGGTAVVESIFAIGGIGSLAISAAQFGDLNVLLGIVLLISTSVLVVGFLTDIAYGYLNPKLRL